MIGQRPWLERLVETAVALLIVALAVHWIWQLVRPVIPAFAVVIIGLVITNFVLDRHRYR